jgi:hypothetical protein
MLVFNLNLLLLLLNSPSLSPTPYFLSLYVLLFMSSLFKIFNLNLNLNLIRSFLQSFLDGLTPREFFEDQKLIKKRRQEMRRLERVASKVGSWEANREARLEEFEAKKVREDAADA